MDAVEDGRWKGKVIKVQIIMFCNRSNGMPTAQNCSTQVWPLGYCVGSKHDITDDVACSFVTLGRLVVGKWVVAGCGKASAKSHMKY